MIFNRRPLSENPKLYLEIGGEIWYLDKIALGRSSFAWPGGPTEREGDFI
jgi:hypothetical protein